MIFYSKIVILIKASLNIFENKTKSLTLHYCLKPTKTVTFREMLQYRETSEPENLK